MRIFPLIMVLTVAAGLAGCDDGPEPTATTCAPGTLAKSLSEIHSETKRQAFMDGCKSFQKAKAMRQWDYKPSPPDDF
ncbi:hypothetical protein MyNCGM152_10320 [Achromobacter xylosoxidans]